MQQRLAVTFRAGLGTGEALGRSKGGAPKTFPFKVFFGLFFIFVPKMILCKIQCQLNFNKMKET